MSFASGVPQTFERCGHLPRFRAQDQPTGVIARDGHQQGQEDTWREPIKDQWKAWIAAWLGWTLDAFDFTIFLLIMLPISQEFGVLLLFLLPNLAHRFGVGMPYAFSIFLPGFVLEYADSLCVDERRILRLLLDLGAVLDLPAEGAQLDAADGSDATVLGQYRGVSR